MDGFPGFVGNMKIRAHINGHRHGIGKGLLIQFAMLLAGEEDGGEHALLCILEGLPVAVVVNA